jgi:hypothetical protein
MTLVHKSGENYDRLFVGAYIQFDGRVDGILVLKVIFEQTLLSLTVGSDAC